MIQNTILQKSSIYVEQIIIQEFQSQMTTEKCQKQQMRKQNTDGSPNTDNMEIQKYQKSSDYIKIDEADQSQNSLEVKAQIKHHQTVKRQKPEKNRCNQQANKDLSSNSTFSERRQSLRDTIMAEQVTEGISSSEKCLNQPESLANSQRLQKSQMEIKKQNSLYKIDYNDKTIKKQQKRINQKKYQKKILDHNKNKNSFQKQQNINQKKYSQQILEQQNQAQLIQNQYKQQFKAEEQGKKLKRLQKLKNQNQNKEKGQKQIKLKSKNNQKKIQQNNFFKTQQNDGVRNIRGQSLKHDNKDSERLNNNRDNRGLDNNRHNKGLDNKDCNEGLDNKRHKKKSANNSNKRGTQKPAIKYQQKVTGLSNNQKNNQNYQQNNNYYQFDQTKRKLTCNDENKIQDQNNQQVYKQFFQQNLSANRQNRQDIQDKENNQGQFQTKYKLDKQFQHQNQYQQQFNNTQMNLVENNNNITQQHRNRRINLHYNNRNNQNQDIDNTNNNFNEDNDNNNNDVPQQNNHSNPFNQFYQNHKTKIKFSIIAIIISIITVVIIQVLYEKCIIYSQKCNIPEIPKKEFVIQVDKRFILHSCSQYDIFLKNQMNNQTFFEEYATSFCVQRVSSTHFQIIASIQKSKDIPSEDADPIEYDPYFYKLWFLDQLNLNLQSQSQEIEENNSSSPEYQTSDYGSSSQTSSDTNYQQVSSQNGVLNLNTNIVWPLYKFSIFKNGTKDRIQFPLEGDQHIRNLLQSFIDAYAPLVSIELYQDLSEPQLNKTNRRLQFSSQNQSSSQNNTVQRGYQTNQDTKQTTLFSTQDISVSNQRQNTQCIAQRDHHFDQNSNLLSSSTNADINFISQPTEQTDQHESMNLEAISVIVSQKLQIKFKRSKIVNQEIFKEIVKLGEDNTTVNLTIQQFKEYLTESDNQAGFQSYDQYQRDNTTTRLLTATKSSLSLVKVVQKDYKIFQMRPVGVQLLYKVYTNIDIKMKQDPANPINKIPQFSIDMGTLLSVGGIFTQKTSMLKYQKELPALPLQFTLNQIQGAIRSLKPNFLNSIKNTFGQVIEGNFDSIFNFKSLSLVTSVASIISKIEEEYLLMDPLKIISEITSLASSAKQLIQNEGVTQILNKKMPIIQDLSKKVQDYCQTNMGDVLNSFRQFKNSIDSYKSKGISYLSEMNNSFESVKGNIMNSTKQMISPQIQKLFDDEMLKCLPILQNLRYVQDGVVNYKNIFLSNFKTHQTNLFKHSQAILTDYLDVSQRNLTDLYYSKISLYNETYQRQYNSIRNPYENFRNQVNNMIQGNLLNIVNNSDLTQNQWINSIKQQFALLANQVLEVSANSGGCCDRNWLRQCVKHNPRQGEIQAQRYNFDAFRAQSEATLINGINSTLLIITQIRKIINENSRTQDKVARFSQLINYFVFPDFTQAINSAKNRLSEVKWIRNTLCGTLTGPLDNYIPTLQSLYTNKILVVNDLINELKRKTNQYMQIYSNELYTELMSKIQIKNQLDTFNKMILNQLDQSFTIFNSMIHYRQQYNTQQFLQSYFKSNNIIDVYITKFYSGLKSQIKQFCQSISIFKESITNTSNQITDNINDFNRFILTQTNKPFYNQMQQMIFNVQSVIPKLFADFKSLPFCDHSNSLVLLVESSLEPLIAQFLTIQEEYKSFVDYWNQQTYKFDSLQKQTSSLVKKFYSLRSFNAFQLWVAKAYKHTFDTISIFNETTREMVKIKENMNSKSLDLNYTDYCKLQTLVSHIKLFNQTLFTLHYEDIFLQAQSKYKNSIKALNLLNFQIIELVVTATQLKNSIQTIVVEFKDGVPNFRNSLEINLQKLKDLKDSFSPFQFNQIKTSVIQLAKSMNMTIFGQIQMNSNQFISEFSQFTYVRKKQYVELYRSNLNLYKNFTAYGFQLKDQYYAKYNSMMNEVSGFLNALQIKDLNDLLFLNSYIKQQYNVFLLTFKDSLKQINNIQKIISGDFEELFKIDKFINKILDGIFINYQQQIAKINDQVNQTLSQLSKDFKDKFALTEAYKQLTKINSLIEIDFTQISKLISNLNTQINQKISKLDQAFKDKILQLNRIKKKIEGIKSSVDQKLSMINQSFKNARKSLTDIRKLLFGVLKEDVDNLITSQINIIMDSTDKLVQEDLKNISSLIVKDLPANARFLSSSIDKAITAYSLLKDERIILINNLKSQLKKINAFVKQQIFNKFQNLVRGQSYIKSKVNNYLSNGNVILYQKALYNKSVPLLNVTIPIPVVIGIFYVDFAINYTLVITVALGIQDFRNIDANTTFGAGLVVYASFSWGIKHIIQVGVFVRGPVLRAEIKPRLIVYNLVPIQLVNFITGVKEITGKNQLAVYGQLYFGIYAFEVQIGFFLEIFWIQIIWLKIKFCIKLLFAKLCFNFKIPVGIIFRPKRFQFPLNIKGIGKQYRLARVKVAELPYY